MDKEELRSFADELYEMGLDKEHIQRVIAEVLVTQPLTFMIPCYVPTIRDIFECKISCKKGVSGYNLDSMICTLHAKRHIDHFVIEELDTMELERRMSKIDWGAKEQLIFLDKLVAGSGALTDHERIVGGIFKDIQYLMLHRNSRAAGTSLQLQHKYWFGTDFGEAIGMDAKMPVFNPVILHRFDLTKQRFTPKEAYQLLNFQPVCKEVSLPDGRMKMWYILNPRTFDNTGPTRLSVYPYFNLRSLLEQVPSKTLREDLSIADRRLHQGSLHIVITDASHVYRMSVDPMRQALIFYGNSDEKLTLEQIKAAEGLKPSGEHVQVKWHKKLFGKNRRPGNDSDPGKNISPK